MRLAGQYDNIDLGKYGTSYRSRMESIKNDIIESERVILNSGEVEEIRYLEGAPSYKILYDKDGKRVKEIVKL